MKARHGALLALIFLLVAALGLPWLLGREVEARWRAWVEQINRQQGQVVVQVRQYDRGWWRSRVVTRLRAVSDPESAVEFITLVSRISHGLTGFRAKTRLLDAGHPGLQAAMLGQPDLLRVEGGFFGAVTAELAIPRLTLADGNGPVSVLEPLSGQLQWNPAQGLRFRLQGPGARLATGQGQLALGGLDIRHRSRAVSDHLRAGHTRASLAYWRLGRRDEAWMAGQEIQFSLESEPQGAGRLALELAAGAGRLQRGERRYQDFSLRLRLSDAHIPSLDRTLAAMARHAEARGGTDPLLDLETFGQAMEGVHALLGRGIELLVEPLRVDSPEGSIKACLRLAHPALDGQGRAAMTSILEQSVGGMRLSLPGAWLRQAPPALRDLMTSLLARGWLVPEGERLVMEAGLEDSVLRVGNEVMRLPPLL